MDGWIAKVAGGIGDADRRGPMTALILAIYNADSAIGAYMRLPFTEDGRPVTARQDGEAWKSQMAVADCANGEMLHRLAIDGWRLRFDAVKRLRTWIIGSRDGDSANVAIQCTNRMGLQ